MNRHADNADQIIQLTLDEFKNKLTKRVVPFVGVEKVEEKTIENGRWNWWLSDDEDYTSVATKKIDEIINNFIDEFHKAGYKENKTTHFFTNRIGTYYYDAIDFTTYIISIDEILPLVFRKLKEKRMFVAVTDVNKGTTVSFFEEPQPHSPILQ